MNKVTLNFWSETVTEKGLETLTHKEEFPIEMLIAMGTDLQTVLLTQVFSELGNSIVLDEGVNATLDCPDTTNITLTEDMLEPRLKHIYYNYGSIFNG